MSRGDRLLVVALVVVAGAVAAAISGSWFIDLRVYVLGAGSAFSSDLYDQQLAGAGLPFTYPPFAAMVMAPFGHLPFAFGAAFVAMVSFLCLWLITRRTLERCPLPISPRWALGLAVLAVAVEPVWATFSFGQVNLIVVALCLLDLTGRHRHRGVMVGLAAGLKLTPLFFVAYLVVTRQFRAAATACATFAATVAVGFLLNPHGATTFWTSAVRDPSRVGSAFFAGNQSITGVLPRWAGEPLPHLVVTAAQGIAGIAALAAAAWLFGRGRELNSVLTAAFGMLAMSPISWSHHWVWAWPAGLVLAAGLMRHVRTLRSGEGRGESAGRGWMLASAGLLVLWSFVFLSRSTWWPPHYDDKELAWSLGQKLLGDTYVVAGVLWVIWALLDARRSASSGTSAVRA